ncbi:MAG: TniB family NTP-binding protein [Methylocystis sp.]
MTDGFAHLFPASREIAALSAEERIRRIRVDRRIDYLRARQALDKLGDLIAFPPRARMPNLLIVGASGMGKTMVVEKCAIMFWRPRHGARMRPLYGPALADRLSGEALARLDPLARFGAARLEARASEEGDHDASAAPSLVSLLDFLTASYRRPSPPKLAEIPGATF